MVDVGGFKHRLFRQLVGPSFLRDAFPGSVALRGVRLFHQNSALPPSNKNSVGEVLEFSPFFWWTESPPFVNPDTITPT